ISLNQNRFTLSADFLSRVVQPEEHPTLVVDRRFRRVNVFRIVGRRHDPPPKPNHLPDLRENWKDHPIAIPVIMPLTTWPLDHQPGLHKRFSRNGGLLAGLE